MKTFIIQDWASNTIQSDGRFNFGFYGKFLGVPMTFNSWDDAEEFLSEMLGDNIDQDRGEYYIERKEFLS